MASSLQPVVLAFRADAALAKGKVVKKGTNEKHVGVCSAATDKSVGIVQNVSVAAEDALEVAVGGGAKGLAGGTITMGDLLTSDSSGQLVATTTANDQIIGKALSDAVVSDLFDVLVVYGNY